MLAIGYSTREFLNTLTSVPWEWLLATIILTGKLLSSRLESRSHMTETNDELLLSIKTVTRNAQHETRNPQLATRNAQPITLNSKL
jgi:hypothetical protein